MKIRRIVPVIAASALVVVACGSDSNSDNSSAATSAGTATAANLVVTAVDPLAWDKPEYTVAAGDVTVTAENDTTQPHDLRIIAADGTQLPLDLEIPSKGDVQSGTASLAAGTYTIICTVPGHGTMKSTLTVT